MWTKGEGERASGQAGGLCLKRHRNSLESRVVRVLWKCALDTFSKQKNKCALQSISFLEGLIGRLKARIMANDGGFCAVFKMLNLNTAVFRCKCLERHGLSHGWEQDQKLRTEAKKERVPNVFVTSFYWGDWTVYIPSTSKDVQICSWAGKAEDGKSKTQKTKTSGDAGYRSPYLSHAKRALYHLSYIPDLEFDLY